MKNCISAVGNFNRCQIMKARSEIIVLVKFYKHARLDIITDVKFRLGYFGDFVYFGY